MNQNKEINRNGFTLIEIAIVLVIIGLLFGGVLKGQAMIGNAKIKRLLLTADDYRAASHAYFDKVGHYPGDTDKDGQMGETAAQRNQFFTDLYNAELVGQDYSVDRQVHPYGGEFFGIYWLNPPGGGTVTDNWLRFDNVPGDVAQEIDTKYDDGDYNDGTISASAAYTTTIVNLYMLF